MITLPSNGAPTRSVQREFDLKLPAGRPLVPLSVCQVLLDRSEDDVLNLIECGQLRWAFNVAAPNAERRELRVYRESILDYLRDAHMSARYDFNPSDELDRVITAILPPGGGPNASWFTASKFARRITCSSQHILNLIAATELAAQTDARRGPNGSPLLLRSGARHFLRRRCEAVLIKNGHRISLNANERSSA